MMAAYYGNCQSSFQLPMDLVSGVMGAWSLTRLSARYTGVACNVRRSSDNATTDVYYDSSGKISTTSVVSAGGDLNTWMGASTLYITSITDLSGNGRNFTTATTSFQPQLVLNSLNGQAVARFAGAQRLTLTSALGAAYSTYFSTYNVAASAARGTMFGNFDGGSGLDSTNTEKTVTNTFRIFWSAATLLLSTTNPFSQNQVTSFIRNGATPNTSMWEGNTLDNSTSSINGGAANAVAHGMGADQRNANPVSAIPLTGDINNILVYSAVLSADKRTQVARSLGHLAGLNV